MKVIRKYFLGFKDLHSDKEYHVTIKENIDGNRWTVIADYGPRNRICHQADKGTFNSIKEAYIMLEKIVQQKRKKGYTVNHEIPDLQVIFERPMKSPNKLDLTYKNPIPDNFREAIW